MGEPAPGYTSGQALTAMEQVAAQTLPNDYTLAWTGSSYQEKATQGSSMLVFGMGIIMVLLILAAQYERWSLPFVVVLAVPFAVFGAITAIWMRGLANDIYFQIALVTLIGLPPKMPFSSWNSPYCNIRTANPWTKRPSMQPNCVFGPSS